MALLNNKAVSISGDMSVSDAGGNDSDFDSMDSISEVSSFGSIDIRNDVDTDSQERGDSFRPATAATTATTTASAITTAATTTATTAAAGKSPTKSGTNNSTTNESKNAPAIIYSSRESPSFSRHRTSTDDSQLEELAADKKKTTKVRIDNYLNNEGRTIDKDEESIKSLHSLHREKSSSSARKSRVSSGEKVREKRSSSSKSRETKRSSGSGSKEDATAVVGGATIDGTSCEKPRKRQTRISSSNSKNKNKEKGKDKDGDEEKEKDRSVDIKESKSESKSKSKSKRKSKRSPVDTVVESKGAESSDDDLLAKVEAIKSAVYSPSRGDKTTTTAITATVDANQDGTAVDSAADNDSSSLLRSPSKRNVFARNRVTPTPPAEDPAATLSGTEPPVQSQQPVDTAAAKAAATVVVAVAAGKRSRPSAAESVQPTAAAATTVPTVIAAATTATNNTTATAASTQKSDSSRPPLSPVSKNSSSFFTKPRQLPKDNSSATPTTTATTTTTAAGSNAELRVENADYKDSNSDDEKDGSGSRSAAVTSPNRRVFVAGAATAATADGKGKNWVNAGSPSIIIDKQPDTASSTAPADSVGISSNNSNNNNRRKDSSNSSSSPPPSAGTDKPQHLGSVEKAPMLDAKSVSFVSPSKNICQSIRATAYLNAVRIAQGEVPKALCASADSTIHIYSILDGTQFPSLEGHTDRVISLAVSNPFYYLDKSSNSCGDSDDDDDNNSSSSGVAKPSLRTLVASGSRDQQLKIWDLDSGKCLHSIRAHKSPIWAVAIAVRQNGDVIIISTSGDGSMRSWNGKTGKKLVNFKGHSDKVLTVFILHPLSASPLVFSAGADKQIHVWELLTGTHIRMLEGHEDEINSVVAGAYSDIPSLKPIVPADQAHLPATSSSTAAGGDSQSKKSIVIVSGSRDLSVKVWDYSTGLLLFELLGHSGCVYEVSLIRARKYGPGGVQPGTPLIVSCSEDATIRLWSLVSGKQINAMKWHSVSVRGLDTAAVILPAKNSTATATAGSNSSSRDLQRVTDPDGSRTIALIASCGWDKTIQFHEVDETIGAGKNSCGCTIS